MRFPPGPPPFEGRGLCRCAPLNNPCGTRLSGECCAGRGRSASHAASPLVPAASAQHQQGTRSEASPMRCSFQSTARWRCQTSRCCCSRTTRSTARWQSCTSRTWCSQRSGPVPSSLAVGSQGIHCSASPTRCSCPCWGRWQSPESRCSSWRTIRSCPTAPWCSRSTRSSWSSRCQMARTSSGHRSSERQLSLQGTHRIPIPSSSKCLGWDQLKFPESTSRCWRTSHSCRWVLWCMSHSRSTVHSWKHRSTCRTTPRTWSSSNQVRNFHLLSH